MKRIGNLYFKIYDIDNLKLADKNARKGKLLQKSVINHIKNSKSNILELQQILLTKSFVNSNYNTFTIFDKKERIIYVLPYFPDRILHHAILNIISSIFIKHFIQQTYSCIPKRGIHKCLNDIKLSLSNVEGTKYCLKLDIKKFYPSIDKEILKVSLSRKFKDNDLLILLYIIIDSNEDGLPIGNYLSQYLANFYLTKFDRWLKQDKKINYYYRYMDDIIILHSDKIYLYDLKFEIISYLKINLNLELSKYQVFPIKNRGIDFIGYKIYHTHILLRKSIKLNFIRMIKYNKNKKSINSYLGWLKWCNSINLQNKYINNEK